MTAPPDQLDSWLSWIDDLPLPEGFSAGQDALQDFIVAEIAAAKDMLLKLSDPDAVHLNMLRGTIAKPTLSQIAHIYGDEWTAAIADAEARGREQVMEILRDEAVDFDSPVSVKVGMAIVRGVEQRLAPPPTNGGEG